jgi:hypothetical protein
LRHLFHLTVGIALLFCCRNDEQRYYQCVTDKQTAAAVKAYTVRIDDTKNLKKPALVFLARGVDENEAYVLVNGRSHAVPALPGETPANAAVQSQQRGKEGWYPPTDNDELLGRIVVPLSATDLRNGVNQIIFEQAPDANGYTVTDARVASAGEKEARVVQMTYRVVTRGTELLA